MTATVRLLRPYGPSASLFALAADALVRGRHEDAARFTAEADRALQWELECSRVWAAADEILRRAGR